MTARIVARSQFLSEASGGGFDVTAFPLVDLWGFSPRAYNRQPAVRMPYDRDVAAGELAPPELRYVLAFRRLVGSSGIEVAGDAAGGYTLTKRTEPVKVDEVLYQAQVDLGGVAKGLVADYAAQSMRSHGFSQGMFSTDSSIYMLESRGGAFGESGAFRVSVTAPRPSASGSATAHSFMHVKAKNCGLSTSGDYGRFGMYGSVRVCHEIDARTGYPARTGSVTFGHAHESQEGQARLLSDEVQGDGAQTGPHGVCSVTFLGPSAMDCDALATALFLMSVEEAVDFYNHELWPCGHDAVMVYGGEDDEHFDVVASLAPDGYRIIDPAYRVVSRIDDSGNLALR